MAMNIGANDVANNVGPAVGSKALTMLGALAIAAIFEAGGALIAGGGMASVFFLLSTLVWIAYTIWVGVLKSDAGANAYGPAPVIDATAAPVEPAAPADADLGESKD